MYFDTGLKVENYIYLIEHVSRCLISIYIPSGEIKIEAYLPWKYTERKINMLLLNHNIVIYSPIINYVLIYDCLKQQIRTIELQGIKADESGFYYSNILIEQNDFIILPFKEKTIMRYGINGELKSKDEEWYLSIGKKHKFNKIWFNNIRMDSACIIGTQLFFSLFYRGENYLCKYELNRKNHSCNIVYDSGKVAIRGVYVYSNKVLFRRMFSDKTEIVLITLDSNEKEMITVNYQSMFEEDIYGDIEHLRGSFKNKILEIDRNKLKIGYEVYNFEYQDVYIANGILFNALKNDIIIPDINYTRKYSIKKIVKEIKNSQSYQEGYRELFINKSINEGKYKLFDLIVFFIEPSSLMNRIKYIGNKCIGESIWEKIQ